MSLPRFSHRSTGVLALLSFISMFPGLAGAESPEPTGLVAVKDGIIEMKAGGFEADPMRQEVVIGEVDGREVFQVQDRKSVPVLPNSEGEIVGMKEGTIIAWCQIPEEFFEPTEAAQDLRAIFSVGGYGPGTFACHLNRSSRGIAINFHGFGGRAEDGGERKLGMNTPPIGSDSIHQFALTWKEGEPLRGYLDGFMVSESKNPFEVIGDTPVANAVGFGGRATASPDMRGVFPGMVFEGLSVLRGEVYSTALSEAQIKERWEAVPR